MYRDCFYLYEVVISTKLVFALVFSLYPH
jgi:hypothetical protein